MECDISLTKENNFSTERASNEDNGKYSQIIEI